MAQGSGWHESSRTPGTRILPRERCFFGKTQQSKEELHCSSRVSLQDYYDRGRGTGDKTRKGPQQSQNAFCKQNPLVPMEKPTDRFFSPSPLFLLLFFTVTLSLFQFFPLRSAADTRAGPMLSAPPPISKQGQMNHIVNAHRVSQTSLGVKQIAFALWGLGHPKENKQNQTNKSLFQVPISNGNVKWVFVYRNGDLKKLFENSYTQFASSAFSVIHRSTSGDGFC